MIAARDPSRIAALVEVLRSIAPCQIWTASDDGGLELADRAAPTLVFAVQSGELDATGAIRRLRRSRSAAREAVVILVSAETTVTSMIAARECGAHETMRPPFTRSDLIRVLEGVALEPRAWIETAGYVGPDRRRFNSAQSAAAARGEKRVSPG